ncbi:MAG: AMP-binding protein, partial [Hydrogenophaga sp.]|nr:AMP-binding protein [Hydrogenophaga sp.]
MTDTALEWTQTPVFARFERIALARPDAVAVRDDGGVLTYGEVLRQARAVASALTGAVPVAMAVAVAVAHDRCFPCAMLGALGAGCPYVPLDLSFPP